MITVENVSCDITVLDNLSVLLAPDDQLLASEVSPPPSSPPYNSRHRDTCGPPLVSTASKCTKKQLIEPFKTVEERVEQRLQAMSEAERRLEQLQKEKERVRNQDLVI